MEQRINIDLSRELWRQLSIRCAELDILKKEAVEQAITLWLKNTEEGDMEKQKAVVEVEDFGDGAIYARRGYGPGAPAVRVEYNFRTGAQLGAHCALGTWAMAELGSLDEDGDFESDCWTEDDLKARRIFTRQVLGWPKESEGWDPPELEDGEEPGSTAYEDRMWAAYQAWIDDYCERVL